MWRIDSGTLTGARPDLVDADADQSQRRTRVEHLALVIGGGYEADQDSDSLHDRHHRQLDLHRRLRDRRPAVARQPRRRARELQRCRASDGLLDPGAYPRHRHRRRRLRRPHVRRRHGRPGLALRHHERRHRPTTSSPAASSRSSAARPPRRRRPEDIRRFYNAPDVAFINTPTATSSTSASARATAAIRSARPSRMRSMRCATTPWAR